MNNHYREDSKEESKQQKESPKIDLGRKFPEAKQVKPEKAPPCNYGKHGPE